MKRKLLSPVTIFFLLLMLLILGFIGYSILHPFSIISGGTLTEQDNNGDLRRTCFYNLQNISFLPASLLDFELSGHSGIELIHKEFDSGTIVMPNTRINKYFGWPVNENTIQLICETNIDRNIAHANAAELHLLYKILIFEFKQTIELKN